MQPPRSSGFPAEAGKPTTPAEAGKPTTPAEAGKPTTPAEAGRPITSYSFSILLNGLDTRTVWVEKSTVTASASTPTTRPTPKES